MVGDNKILTVSYGTFSCTLEGFDDPFSTMRSIAEYFRDLAADDRYFGAEPPTPDPERLHMIAQAAVAAPVEARIGDSGNVTLRQSESTEAEDIQDLAALDGVDATDASTQSDDATEDSAEEANEDRQVDEIESSPAEHDELPDETDSDDVEVEQPEPVAESDDFDPESVIAAVGTEPKLEATDYDEPTEIAEPADDVEPEEEVAEQATAPLSSVAEKLARIRSVVGQATTTTVDDDPEEIPQSDDLNAAFESEVESATVYHPFDESDDGAEETATQESDAPSDVDFAESTSEEAPAAMREFEEGLSAGLSGGDSEVSDEAVAVETESMDEPEPIPAQDDQFAASEPEEAVDDAEAQEAGAGAAMFEQNTIDNGNGTADRIFEEADSQLEESGSKRRRSAIAHLKAAVSATVGDRDILGRKQANTEDEVEAYRRDLEDVVSAPSAEPAEAQQSLEYEVEAAEASFEEATQTDIEDSAVAEEQTETAEEPEPLVLGQSERIDSAESTPTHSGTPALSLTQSDMVSGDDDSMYTAEPNESFREFAERVGAHELSDLLEAAAAYSGQVEGRPEFSRPQIMQHVTSNSSEEYSREDGLRSFGALLRQGKIQKLKRGTFVLGDSSRFTPAQRMAGE